MTQTRFNGPPCPQMRAKLDSYLDNELPAESNLDLLDHFRSCTSCTREADERRNLRTRLKSAVRETSVPADLESRLRSRLRDSSRPAIRRLPLMAIAAALLICFGSGMALRRARESHLEAMLRIGLDDHVHCAVGRQLPKPHGGGVNKLQGPFHDLAPVVREHVPTDLPLSVAHECHFQGRTYVHLTFRNERTILSLVITRKRAAETLEEAPRTIRSGQYQVAGFESGGYLIYTVSDLSRQKNLDVLADVALAIRQLVNRKSA
jgi:anti-sigma factor (TIGR02949 family)